MPLAFAFPCIFYLAVFGSFGPAMAHAHGGVAFAIERIGDECEGRFGDDLPDENDAPFPGVAIFVSHIESQVYLFEVDMKRDRDTQHAGIFKQETHEADVAGIVPGIEFGFSGYVGLKDRCGYGIIGEGEVEPLGGEERHDQKFVKNNYFGFDLLFFYSTFIFHNPYFVFGVGPPGEVVEIEEKMVMAVGERAGVKIEIKTMGVEVYFGDDNDFFVFPEKLGKDGVVSV